MIIDGRRPKYSEQNLSYCHFVHQKSDTDCRGTKSGLSGQKATPSRLCHRCPSQVANSVINLRVLISKKLRFENNACGFTKKKKKKKGNFSLNLLNLSAVNVICKFKPYEILRRVDL
jgi:hypothetical protein